MRPSRHLTLFGLWIVSVSAPLASQNERGYPLLRNFSARETKGSVQNWSVVQDRRGFLYFGNTSGILEFDGSSWQIVATEHSTSVRALAIDSGGTIYAGGQGEFGYLAGDSAGNMVFRSLQSEVPETDREFADVWDVVPTPEGVYFLTRVRLFRWDGRRMHVWKPQTDFDFCSWTGGRLLIRQSDVGLMALRGDSAELLPRGELLAVPRIQAILEDPAGPLIVTRAHGFYRLQTGGVAPLQTSHDRFFRENQTYKALALNDGRIVVTTIRSGVAILDRDLHMIGLLDKSMGLQENLALNLYQHRDQALWLGLNNGVARVEVAAPVSLFDERSGLRGGVETVTRHEGRLYVGTMLGVSVLEETRGPNGGGHRFESLGNDLLQCWSLLSTPQGLLAATSHGVFKISGKSVRKITDHNAFQLLRSVKDSACLFVGLKDGLARLRLRDGRWSDDGRINGVHEHVRTIVEMPDGTLWLGTTYQGTLRLLPAAVDYAVQRFGPANGLPVGRVSIFQHDQGLSFGTDSGLYRFDPASFLADTAVCFFADSSFGDRLLGSNYVYLMVQEAPDRMWISATRSGLAARDVDAQRYRWEPSAFDRFPETVIYAIYPEAGGVVWFSTDDALVRYDRKWVHPLSEGPSVFIRKVRIGGDSVIYGGWPMEKVGEPRLSYRNNALRFECAAPVYEQGAELMYQYRLDGLDPDWSVWTRENRKDYTNLSEGYHRFLVRVRDGRGRISPEAVYAFTILPPWQRTWWAYALYVLAGAALVAGTIRMRIRVLQKRNVELERRIEERTRDLRQTQAQLIHAEKMASLGRMVAGMAHEINNPLTFIQPNLQHLEDKVDRLFHLVRLYEEDRSDRGSLRTEIEQVKEELQFDLLKEDVQSILRSSIEGSRRIRQIIDHLLSFSQELSSEKSKVDLGSHLETVTELFLRRLSDIRLEKHFAQGLVVEGNPGELNQCFIDILDNAVQAIREAEASGHLGAGQGVIGITTEPCTWKNREGASVLFSDNGIGMSREVIDKIFEPFFTTRKIGVGRGLGLSEVYGLIQKHGGSIEVRSDPGQGSEFRILLPLRHPRRIETTT
jgi:signal transduction histidine kinase/ligand-binding sensor domain-containing protein